MTLPSGSSFRSTKNNLWTRLLGFVCAGLATACASSPEGPKSAIGAAPGDAAQAPGRRIAPPKGSTSEAKKAERSAVDKLLADIPEEARDADTEVVVPLDASAASPRHSTEEQRRREARAVRTDNEIVGAQRSLDERQAKELGSIERELGVESEEGGTAAPSFTLTVQRIKDLFKAKEYEDALIEANEALQHFPRSAQILMMKGTLHQRLQQVELALAAYERAFEIEPTRKLQAQIDYLRAVIADRSSLQKYREGVVIPGEVSATPGRKGGGE